MNYEEHQDRAMVEPADYIQGLLGDNDDEELQEAIMEGLEALDGCEEFDIEGLPDLHQMEDFNVWLMGLDASRASSPMVPPPSPVMIYAGDGVYHAVPADNVRWEGQPSVNDSSVMEVAVEEASTPDLIIVTDDEDDDVEIVCEVANRSRKRSRERSPSPPPAKRQRRASI